MSGVEWSTLIAIRGEVKERKKERKQAKKERNRKGRCPVIFKLFWNVTMKILNVSVVRVVELLTVMQGPCDRKMERKYRDRERDTQRKEVSSCEFQIYFRILHSNGIVVRLPFVPIFIKFPVKEFFF